MKPLWHRLMYEPALLFGIPTVVFATAAGVWSAEWLAFGAAALAGIGTLVTRDNTVTKAYAKDNPEPTGFVDMEANGG